MPKIIKSFKFPRPYIIRFIQEESCFDLQFRRDIKTTRPGKPVYYTWKAQFIIQAPKDKLPILEQIHRLLRAGAIHTLHNVARYSVQDLESLRENIVSFFEQHSLEDQKRRKDFELWADAVIILYRNKNDNNAKKGTRGFTRTQWKKKDFQRLLDILQNIQPYKAKRKNDLKWLEEAQLFAKTLRA